jgi:hypothetical protein
MAIIALQPVLEALLVTLSRASPLNSLFVLIIRAVHITENL